MALLQGSTLTEWEIAASPSLVEPDRLGQVATPTAFSRQAELNARSLGAVACKGSWRGSRAAQERFLRAELLHEVAWDPIGCTRP